MRPGEGVTIDSEPQSRAAVEQDLECHAGFEPGQRSAQAVMDPVTEAEVRRLAAAYVECVGRREAIRVPVSRAKADQHLLAAGDLDAVETHRLGCHAERGMGDRGSEPDELVDRSGKLPEVGKQGFERPG